MATIDECYNSLQIVQDNLDVLRKDYKDACEFQVVATSLLDDSTASLSIESLEDDVKRVMKNKGASAGLCIFVLYPITILIAIAVCRKFGWNPQTSIICFTSSTTVSNFKDVKAFIKNLKKYKVIRRLKSYVDKQEELSGKTIKQISTLLCNKNIELFAIINKREKAIQEYQNMLEDAKKNLANDILEDAGIDARIDVTLGSNKIENKELKKINVNK